MWTYEKRLQHPVNIKKCDPNMAALIISQFGGPDGELAASQRYLSQRYSVPYGEVAGLLTDIGTEELAHMEMICAIVHQLTRNLTPEQIKKSTFAPFYIDHTTGLWPAAASGAPFSARPAPLSFLLQKKAAKKMRRKDRAFRPLRRAAQGSALRTRRLLK